MCWMYSAESLISWQNFELLRVSFIFRYTFILKCIQLKLNSTWWGKHIIMFYNILFVGFIRSRLFSGLNLKSKTHVFPTPARPPPAFHFCLVILLLCEWRLHSGGPCVYVCLCVCVCVSYFEVLLAVA